MKYSTLLTIHDRDEIDLQKVLKQLAKAAAGREDEIEFVIGFDFKEGEFPVMEQIVEVFSETIPHDVHVVWYDTVSEHPETYNDNGHCIPVAINNQLLDKASGDNIVWISSDVIVHPFLYARIDMHCEDGILDTVYVSRVIDQDSCAEFCGPTRPFPIMCAVAHPATGERFDMELLKGYGFDDNDWMARMGNKFGSITIDCACFVIHQTHGHVAALGQLASGKAYGKKHEAAWKRSTEYMKAKYKGGVPFDGQTLAVEYNRVGDFIVLNINGLRNGEEFPS